jgi:hypothetical protein
MEIHSDSPTTRARGSALQDTSAPRPALVVMRRGVEERQCIARGAVLALSLLAEDITPLEAMMKTHG